MPRLFLLLSGVTNDVAMVNTVAITANAVSAEASVAMVDKSMPMVVTTSTTDIKVTTRFPRKAMVATVLDMVAMVAEERD